MLKPAVFAQQLESYFEFERLGTKWTTELNAGFTTFITMAYIVVVNPSILHDAGMPIGAVTVATCLSAAFGSILMGVFARYPIALAPGMGLNAYFAYTIVKGMGISWQAALGAVFLSGVAFLLLTLSGLRQLVIAAIPQDLYWAVSVGVGLFIAMIGLRNAGFIVPKAATLVSIGNFRDPNVALAALGLLVMAVLMSWRVRSAILIGVVAVTALSSILGLSHWKSTADSGDLWATALQLNVKQTLGLGFWEIVFVFLFVDFFDNLGTLAAVGKKANLFDRSTGEIPRLKRILITDSLATIFSSLTGTSTVVSYVESAAGVGVGGRSGVTAVVVGLLFLVSLSAVPLIRFIPAAATAPALIVVGSMMMSGVKQIDWEDAAGAIPAFLTVMMIPLTFSIANGLACGFIAYCLIRLFRGEWRTVHWLAYVLTALFIVRFLYLGGLG